MSSAPALLDLPDAIAQAWRARGWPDDLLARAVELRTRHSRIKRWASDPRWTVEKLRAALDRRAALVAGSMRVREAAAHDAAALANLYAGSPQDVGAWSVTVERSPNPFAQFALQEHARVYVLDHDGVLLATSASSTRASFVAGRPVAVHMASAFRARAECRSEGLGPLVQRATLPATVQEPAGTYYYRRALGKPGLRATVYGYPSRPFTADPRNIRLARPADIPGCVALINRTHGGLDLFRPYDDAYLQTTLGQDPTVYGWADYYVVEDAGQVVACAGLWDRGRHMREQWLHKSTGERRLVENAALLDFGYAEGHDDAMALLIGHLIGVTDTLGRGQLLAPLEFLPSLRERLVAYGPVADTRALYWLSNPALKKLGVAKLTKPYTDLAYW